MATARAIGTRSNRCARNDLAMRLIHRHDAQIGHALLNLT
jgi:hypothetical protein